jgi:hypothetical protein
MNSTIKDVAEKLVVAIHEALGAEIPLKNVRDKAYDDYSKANDEYMKSRGNIAELCRGLDAIVPDGTSYPIPEAWARVRRQTGAIPEWGAVNARCAEIRAIEDRNRRIQEEQGREIATMKERGEDITKMAFAAPEPVL